MSKTQDFVAQIQEAEEQAARLLETAKEKATKTTIDAKEESVKANELVLNELRDSKKQTLKSHQNNVKQEYEKQVIDGKKAAQKLEQEATKQIDKAVPMLKAYLLNDLLVS